MMLKLKFKFRETRKFQNFMNFCFLGLDGDDARDIPSWRTRDQRGCIRVSERSDAAPVLSWKTAKAIGHISISTDLDPGHRGRDDDDERL